MVNIVKNYTFKTEQHGLIVSLLWDSEQLPDGLISFSLFYQSHTIDLYVWTDLLGIML